MRARSIGLVSVIAAVVVAIVLSVPISGISGIEKKAEAQATPTILKIGFMGHVDSLNPYVGVNDASFVLYGLLYDALTCIDNKMNVTGNLALNTWAVPTSDPALVLSGEPFGSVWQYNLTHNALWNDGEPFTADDVVWNIQANAENYTMMWAYQPYSYNMNWAEKVDDYTVRIHFYDRSTTDSIPAAYGYSLPMYMLPEHLLGHFPAANLSFSWPGYFDNVAPAPPIVGTGPFMATQTIYDDFLVGDHITLVKNPNYHGTADYGQTVQFDQIRMNFYDDATAMRLALQTGEIDVAQFPAVTYKGLEYDVNAGSVENIELFSGLKMNQYWTEITFCMNNAGPNPARLDKVIRHALAMATNKTYIVDNFYLGLGDEATTIIPPVNSKWHYEPNATEKASLEYNLVAAAQLLEDNGYRYPTVTDPYRVATVDSPAVKLGLVTVGTVLGFEMLVRVESPEEKEIALYLQDQWSQVGVQLNILIVSEAEMSARVYFYSYDTAIWYWTSDIDPNYMLFVKSKVAWSGWNDNMWFNASYEENYSLSVRTMDYSDRREYVNNSQRIEFLDTDYILLAYPNQTYAWRNDTFAGWGDWAANPGRSIDNYYSANPLWFDLYSIAPPTNEPPIASIVVTPGTGTTSTLFTLNASSSSDSDDPVADLQVRWDFDGDGTWDTDWNTSKVIDWQYFVDGTYNATVEVRDSGNLTDTAVQQIVVTFEVIPEFGSIVLPVVSLAGAVCLVLFIRRRR